jgi:hypothetical protein
MLRHGLVILLSLSTGGAFAQDLSFLLINSTSYPISELHLSPPNLNYWGRNSLMPPPLKVGESRVVAVAPYANECIQDVRVVFANNASLAVWQGLNICGLQKLRLFFDAMSGITTAQYD